MKQRSEFFSNFGWPDYLFYLQKLPDPPPLPPRNQLVVPKTNQEINEPSYEMVGVKITGTNYGQNKSYFKAFFFLLIFYFLLWQLQMFSSYWFWNVHTNNNLHSLCMRYVSSNEDFKFWDFLVLFRFPQMGPRVIHYYRFQCFCPVFRINWLSQNEIHCSW